MYLVLRVAVGLLLMWAAWMDPDATPDEARRLVLLITFVWIPTTALLDAALRRRHHRAVVIAAAAVDLIVFLPAMTTLGGVAGLLAVAQVPVVMAHSYLDPRPVADVSSGVALGIALAAEWQSAGTTVGPVAFLALVCGLSLAMTVGNMSSLERVLAADQIARHYGKAEALVTSVTEAVVVTSPRGRIDEWNDSAGRTIGCDRHDAVGRRCEDVLGLRRDVAALDCSQGCAVLAAQLAEDTDLELWRPLPNGDRQPLLVNTSPVLDADGRVKEVIHSLRDITAIRKADEAKTLFLATASHELKTPLAVIRGYAELMLEQPDDEGLRTAGLDAIRRRAEQLTSIVERLLISSRIEAGRLSLELSAGAIGPIVDERTRSIQQSTGRRLLVTQPDDIPDVSMSSDAVATILDHLLENAAKYSDDDRSIGVHVDVDAETVAVSVTDHGVGMSSDQVEHCFDKFWQAESADMRRFGGTGIGLFIVKALVEGLGGTINACSTPDMGTTFTFTLWRADVVRTVEEEPVPGPKGEESIIKEFMRQVGIPVTGAEP